MKNTLKDFIDGSGEFCVFKLVAPLLRVREQPIFTKPFSPLLELSEEGPLLGGEFCGLTRMDPPSSSSLLSPSVGGTLS